MRHYIRHPTGIPIEVSRGHQPAPVACHGHDVSHGGLAFRSECGADPGSIVEVRIPLVQPPFETKARVVWCSSRAGGFELGVEFLDRNDAFRVRMIEQVCYIEDYRKAVHESEGRVLTAEEAALEWIHKHAAQFPPGSDDIH